MVANGALDGLRVVELATLFAAPLIGTMLGDLGADVVKIEPPEGDPMRTMGASRDGHSLVWAYVARNKRSVVADFGSPDGLAAVHALIEVADVVIFNQPQTVLSKWRCTYDEISRHNPRAVVVEMSGYGHDGPFGGLPANGTMSEAFGAVASMIGEPDGPPTLPSFPLGDTTAAWQGVMGVLAACYARDARGGTGQLIDLAMYEPILALLATSAVAWNPGEPPPHRNGSRVHGGVPRNCYRTADDHHVVVSGPTDAQVSRILQLIGRSTPDDLARFGRSEQRLANADELDSLVAAWVSTQTADRVIAALTEARIPVSPANDLADVFAHPQVQHRQSLRRFHDPVVGDVTMPGPLPGLVATPPTIRTPAPPLGAHTAEVRRNWLGTS
ncbi:MAG: CoA transferase [Acidimicrobiales bacterium]|nr:CoA transferase [Acidimicrobiales bacterium]